MTERELEGRVAVVFGAGSSGQALSNGEAAALAYARAGAVVACVDRVTEQAERVAAPGRSTRCTAPPRRR